MIRRKIFIKPVSAICNSAHSTFDAGAGHQIPVANCVLKFLIDAVAKRWELDLSSSATKILTRRPQMIFSTRDYVRADTIALRVKS